MNSQPFPGSCSTSSAAKEISTERRACLGAERFEELQIMKFAWRDNIPNLAQLNSENVEQVDFEEYEDLLAEDEAAVEWDQEFPTELVLSD